MKLALKLCFFLMIPAAAMAQDTAVVKRQAQAVAKAVIAGDYSTVINSMYPKVVTMAGGKQKVLQMMTTAMKQMKAQGVTFESATIGSPGKFYKAGNEIHCLVPQYMTLKMGANSMRAASNLLAVSKDGGKKWSFLDLNRNTVASIPKIFPNFNPALKIPEPKQMGM